MPATNRHVSYLTAAKYYINLPRWLPAVVAVLAHGPAPHWLLAHGGWSSPAFHWLLAKKADQALPLTDTIPLERVTDPATIEFSDLLLATGSLNTSLVQHTTLVVHWT